MCTSHFVWPWPPIIKVILFMSKNSTVVLVFIVQFYRLLIKLLSYLLSYSLFQRSCLTWIFFVDPHWWVPLCMQCPAKAIPFQQIIIHALQCQHDIYVHLLFCFDLDLHLTCSQVHVWLGFSSLILTDGYHFVCSTQQSICHFDKLSCIYCNAHMIYMYTYFVLTFINSCFVHVQ